MADKMEEKAKKTEEKGGRLKWKDDATQERNQKHDNINSIFKAHEREYQPKS